MYELPLFPLHAVLFPGSPLHLHIFEERYKRMINLCINGDHKFGVVLIQQGAEALSSLAKPNLIGSTAHIAHVQQLDEGRMNIAVIGRERFRILSWNDRIQPYLLGYVETYPLIQTDRLSVEANGQKLRIRVERYLNILSEAGAGQFDLDQLPGDAIKLAYFAASILQISYPEKQEILSLEKAEDLVEKVIQVFRREIALINALLARTPQDSGVISAN